VETAALTSRGPDDEFEFSRSFLRDTITMKVSGSAGGIQRGPFHGLAVTQAEQGRQLIVRLVDATSVGGTGLAGVPIHLYRSLSGAVSPGDRMIAFSEPPVRNAEEIAADRGGRAVVVQMPPPGHYFVFFPFTQPVVRVPAEALPATITYWVAVE
jgi:hypothetical protein